MTTPPPRDATPGAGHADLPPEDVEWVDELVTSWVEVYKKAASTLALLRIVREAGEPVPATTIGARLLESTGWALNERALYRSLRRLADAGLLTTTQVAVARTGARRQDFALSPVGQAYLTRIEAAHLP